MRRLLLKFLARLGANAPILVLSACAVVTAVAGVGARRLFPPETDLLALLPESVGAQALRRSHYPFGTSDYLLAVIESRQPHQESVLIDLATSFAQTVRSYELYVESIEYEPGGEKQRRSIPEMDERLLPAVLTNAELLALDRALHGELQARVARLRSELALPISSTRRRRLLEDPLQLERLLRRNRMQPQAPVRGPSRSGTLISDDGQMLIMVIRPRRPATDLMETERLMRWLRDAARYAIAQNGSRAEDCQIGFIGSHAEAETDASVLRRDLTLTLCLSFVLVVLLFVLAVRRIGAIFFVAVPLAAAVIWTLGAASLFIDDISVVTCVFGAALFGLGIDYAIHLYNRYLEERTAGIETAQALEIALCETGQGVVVGGLTTAMGFGGMCFIPFQGLQELGLVGATAILCCLAAMLLILPSLVALSELTPTRLGFHSPPSSLGLGRLAATIETHPRMTLTAGLIVTAYLGFFAQRIEFNDSVRSLRQPPETYSDLVLRTANRFELPSHQLIAVVTAPSYEIETALEYNDRLYRRLEDAQSSYPMILGYDSLRRILPSRQTQREAQARLRSILDLDAIAERFRLVTRTANLGTTVTEGTLRKLQQWKASATEENLVRFGGDSSGTFVDLVYRYFYLGSIVTYIYPRQGVWERRVPAEFVKYLRGEDPSTIDVTGLPFLAAELRRLFIHGIVRAVMLVILAVFLVLILHFRSARKATVAVIPVLCSVVWTLGTMQLLGMQVNFLNLIVIPLILSLGIDDGVHILQRYYEGGRHDLERSVEETGRAVVITSLTTMLAFGTLLFATFRGVREIGLVAIMGVGFALIASLLLVPALLRIAGGTLRLIDLVAGPDENDRAARR